MRKQKTPGEGKSGVFFAPSDSLRFDRSSLRGFRGSSLIPVHAVELLCPVPIHARLGAALRPVPVHAVGLLCTIPVYARLGVVRNAVPVDTIAYKCSTGCGHNDKNRCRESRKDFLEHNTPPVTLLLIA